MSSFVDALTQRYNLPPMLLGSTAMAESGGNPNAVSPAGAQGLMQFMPATAQQYGIDPMNPGQAMDGAARLYRDLISRYGGDTTKAIAAYNAGAGRVDRAGGIPQNNETPGYVQKVAGGMSNDPEAFARSLGAKPVGGGDAAAFAASLGAKPIADATQQSAPNVDEALPQTIAGIPVSKNVAAATIGAGRSLDQLWKGVKQSVLQGKLATPAGPVDLRPYMPKALTDRADAELASMKAAQDADTATYKPLQDAYPNSTMVGEAAPYLVAPVGAGVKGAALSGALVNSLSYGSPDERLARAGAGAAGGAVGAMAGKALGRVINPVRGAGTATNDALANLANKFDVPTSLGQQTGSAPIQWMESVLASGPGGGNLRALANDQESGLGRALMGTMGASGDAVTPGAVDMARQGIGQRIGSIPQGVTVNVDDQLLNHLADVESRYGNKLDALQRPVVQNLIDDISSRPSMTGEFYQNTRSDISRMAAGASGGLKDALTGIYKGMDRAFDRSAGPDAAAAMAGARQQYVAAKAIGKMATADGNVTAAKIAASAKGAPGDLGQLAALASSLKPLPNSGTMQRLMYQSILSGGVGSAAGLAQGDPTEGAKWGAASFAAPWLATQALTRAPIRNYLASGLLGMRVTPATEQLLQRLGGTAGLLGAAANQ